MLLYTGLRLAELVALDVDDVRVSARKGLVIVRSGKGDAYREVPLNALVRQVLEEWLAERKRRRPEGERAVFVGRGGRRLSKRSVDDVVRGLGEDAGVKLSAHILRHTFLTRMVRQGSISCWSPSWPGTGGWRPRAATASPRTSTGCWRSRTFRSTSDVSAMPTRFLSDAEIERLERFPEAIDQPGSRPLLLSRRRGSRGSCAGRTGRPGQLGIALQLCALRWLGFVPDDLSAAPPEAIAAVGRRAGRAGARDLRILGACCRRVGSIVRGSRARRVRCRGQGRARVAGERGWSSVRSSTSGPRCCSPRRARELRRRRIERPAVDRVMRLVAWARERAHEQNLRAARPGADRASGAQRSTGC